MKRNRDHVPIYIGYEDDGLDPPIRQTVTFESCVFDDMAFGQDFLADNALGDTTAKLSYADSLTDFATMIVATHPSNTVIVRDCVFQNGNNVDSNVRTRVS